MKSSEVLYKLINFTCLLVTHIGKSNCFAVILLR